MSNVTSIRSLMLDDVDLSSYIFETEGMHKLKSPSAWETEILDSMFAPVEARGAYMPWSSLSGFRMRSGELTVWGGYNESRKSMLTGQVMLGCADQDEPVVIASLEMRPRETVERLIRQWLMKADPTKRDALDFLDWAKNKIWIYDHLGHCEAKKLFAVMRYAAEKLHVKHFLIDSLMRVVRGTDDYNGQKNIVDSMIEVAKDTGMHVHLVAHNKKPQAGEKQTRYSVKGASEISDLAFNVVIVERPENDKGEKPDDQPDAWLKVAKQRNHNWKGSIRLYLHGETGAFSDNQRYALNDFGIRKGE